MAAPGSAMRFELDPTGLGVHMIDCHNKRAPPSTTSSSSEANNALNLHG